MNIGTGELIRKLYGADVRHAESATWLARNFAGAMYIACLTLLATDTARCLFGAPLLASASHSLSQINGGRVPQWIPALSQPVRLAPPPAPLDDEWLRVVYFAAYVLHAMGPAFGDEERKPLLDKTRCLLEKAGCQVMSPDNPNNLCCGQPPASKGYAKQADDRRDELLAALLQASRSGLDPIYYNINPCTLRLIQGLDNLRLQVHDPVKFIRSHLLDRLEFIPQDKPVVVHVACSAQHLGEGQAPINLVGRRTREVAIPEGTHCCGLTGDKGSTTPELNTHSLCSLKDTVQFCEKGVSTSRTCEISPNGHSGIDYRGVVYLVDRVTQAKGAPRQGE